MWCCCSATSAEGPLQLQAVVSTSAGKEGSSKEVLPEQRGEGSFWSEDLEPPDDEPPKLKGNLCDDLCSSVPKPFIVVLRRGGLDMPWGMVADTAGQKTPLVCSVVQSPEDSPVCVFNSTACSDECVQEGDYILAINGITSKVPQFRTLLVEEMRRSKEAQLIMQRPHLFELRLTRKGAEVGLDISYTQEGRSLAVGCVSEESASRCEPKLQHGDRIVAVHKRGGQSLELLQMIREAQDPVFMTVSRCV